jgi:hypothetical protein
VLESSFVRIWSSRFFEYRAYRQAPFATIRKFQSQLAEAHSGDWTRVVLERSDLEKHWGISRVTCFKDLDSLLTWTETMHAGPTLLRPRNFFGVEAGVQVWFSTESDLLLWKITGLRCGQMRVFTQAEFQETVAEYLGAPPPDLQFK